MVCGPWGGSEAPFDFLNDADRNFLAPPPPCIQCFFAHTVSRMPPAARPTNTPPKILEIFEAPHLLVRRLYASEGLQPEHQQTRRCKIFKFFGGVFVGLAAGGMRDTV
jgi:hypothetical protein